jgi:hypothetical protein
MCRSAWTRYFYLQSAASQRFNTSTNRKRLNHVSLSSLTQLPYRKEIIVWTWSPVRLQYSLCMIWSSRSGYNGEFCLLGYNTLLAAFFTLFFCLVYSWALKMEVTYSSETSIFTGLHGVISQQRELFMKIRSTVRSWFHAYTQTDGPTEQSVQ